jgi:hypothetical protein
LGIFLGLAVGTKISALVFGSPVFLVFLIQVFKIFKRKNILKNIVQLFIKNLILLVSVVFFAILSSPYLVVAFRESKSTLLYETSVATGQSQVFYTRQFIETKPVLFQLQKIFPYALGWPIFIFGMLGVVTMLLFLIMRVIKKEKKPPFDSYFLLLTSFLTYFFFQSFLFTKWTRFQAPIFAFFPIFAVISLSYLRNLRFLRCLLILFSIVPGIVFSSIYFQPDIRFTASDWIFKNIPSESKILYDTGNVVDVPIIKNNFTSYRNLPAYSRVSFDFYHMDENPELINNLYNNLKDTDYIIVPSRRIFKNHMRFPDSYPQVTKYYEDLFSGKLGYSFVKEFRPFSFLGNFSIFFQDEEAEETFSVFDHPVIRIYKKI